MMSPKSRLTPFQKFWINVLKCGPIPKHIAFILDGNRRFATKNNLLRSKGHHLGYDKLWDVLKWCTCLGVNEATIYTFSIANFQRTAEEVELFINLMKEKFRKLFEDKEILKSDGICIRIIGNISYIPEDLRKLMAKVVKVTKHNNKFFLNMAFAYTSHDEIEHAVEVIVEGVQNGAIQLEDIDEDLFTNCLYTSGSSKPDIVIRTSGEVRFSDFLLWQIGTSQISFIQPLWPEISIWNLFGCILKYQRCYDQLTKYEKVGTTEKKKERVQKFIDRLQQQRLTELTD